MLWSECLCPPEVPMLESLKKKKKRNPNHQR